MLIPITLVTSINTSLQWDMCLYYHKHRSADALLCSLLLHCLLRMPSIYPLRKLWRWQFDFKGCLTTWGLIKIYWRSIVITWGLFIWQRTRWIMQKWSTSTSSSTLFGRFLMRVTTTCKRFTRRRISLISNQGCSESEDCTLQGVTPYHSSCLSSVALIWMNYGWLDPLDRGYVSNDISVALMESTWCYVRSRLEKSSSRYRIVERVQNLVSRVFLTYRRRAERLELNGSCKNLILRWRQRAGPPAMHNHA